MTSRALALAPAAAAMITVMAAACSESERPVNAEPQLSASEGELTLSTPTGAVWRSEDLVGATLAFGELTVRLESVQIESTRHGDIVLHDFVVLDHVNGESELCHADPMGERWSLPVLDEQGNVELVCTSGAKGKCARAGYWPGEPATAALHEACVRMTRADYGGDGSTATRDGTGIAFCDRAGLNPCWGDEVEIAAAWSAEGATCVARTRVPELLGLTELGERYPALKAQSGASCTMTAAWEDPRALLFSFPT